MSAGAGRRLAVRVALWLGVVMPVIVYVGGKSAWLGSGLTEGEGRDTANIDLPAQRVELINAVTAVVSMGRPQGLAPVIDRLPAEGP